MESAKISLDRIKTAVFNLEHLTESAKEAPISPEEREVLSHADSLEVKFNTAMEDDFNTADAISAIFELVKLSNSNASGESSKEFIQILLKKITVLCDILGIETKQEVELLDDEIQSLIDERQAAKKSRDFARADAIRNELLEKGIILEDTREGVRWKRA